MKTITFKLVYNWTKYAPKPSNFQRYDLDNKRAEKVVKLSFTKSSAIDYKTILARLKLELGLNVNPAYILFFNDDKGVYEYLGKEVLRCLQNLKSF